MVTTVTVKQLKADAERLLQARLVRLTLERV